MGNTKTTTETKAGTSKGKEKEDTPPPTKKFLKGKAFGKHLDKLLEGGGPPSSNPDPDDGGDDSDEDPDPYYPTTGGGLHTIPSDSNGKLLGELPSKFRGELNKAKEFISNLLMYFQLNIRNEQMRSPMT